jgi:hypothetical protein
MNLAPTQAWDSLQTTWLFSNIARAHADSYSQKTSEFVKIRFRTRIDAKYIATGVELHFSASVVLGFAWKERARFLQVAIIVVKVVEFKIAFRVSTLQGTYHQQQEQRS